MFYTQALILLSGLEEFEQKVEAIGLSQVFSISPDYSYSHYNLQDRTSKVVKLPLKINGKERKQYQPHTLCLGLEGQRKLPTYVN